MLLKGSEPNAHSISLRVWNDTLTSDTRNSVIAIFPTQSLDQIARVCAACRLPTAAAHFQGASWMRVRPTP